VLFVEKPEEGDRWEELGLLGRIILIIDLKQIGLELVG
jgi:hypothetical protein